MSVYARRAAAIYCVGPVPDAYKNDWMARFGDEERGPFDSKEEAIQAETEMWAAWLAEQDNEFNKRTETNEESK